MSRRLDAESYVAHLRATGALDDVRWPRSLAVALGAGPPGSQRNRGRAKPRQTPFGQLHPHLLVSHAVGSPAMTVVVECLAVLGVREIVVVGRAGALIDRFEAGQRVVAQGAFCDDGTSRVYGGSGVVRANTALVDALSVDGAPTAVTVTTDAPFLLDDVRLAELRRRRVELVEMELAGAIVAGCRNGVDVGALLVVSDARAPGSWTAHDPAVVARSLQTAVAEAVAVVGMRQT
jgi:uridine phosphorylase